MHGQGSFFDPPLDDAEQFPVAAKAKLGHVQPKADLITSKLAALHFYQLAILAAKPEKGSFDAAAAERGEKVFNAPANARPAKCPRSSRNRAGACTQPRRSESTISGGSFTRQALRTTPLRGLLAHAKGGFYHDGRFKDLDDVVDHYQGALELQLTDQQQKDLVEYLKSL
jgi:cytochrome c peroxidase